MNCSDCLIAGMKWLARLWALAMAGLILLIAVDGGLHPTRLQWPELILFVPLFLAWLGLWLGWRWEGLGGALVVVGMASFYLTHFALTGFGRSPRGWAFPVMAVPGLLFLLCWSLRRKGPGKAQPGLHDLVSRGVPYAASSLANGRVTIPRSSAGNAPQMPHAAKPNR